MLSNIEPMITCMLCAWKIPEYFKGFSKGFFLFSGECSESQTPSARSVSSSASGWSTSNSSVSGVSYSGMSR